MSRIIAIFDHVGKKAGMDYYSSSLMKGLTNQGCQGTIYSNFTGIESDKIKYNPVYEGHFKGNAILKLYRFLRATIKASRTPAESKQIWLFCICFRPIS